MISEAFFNGFLDQFPPSEFLPFIPASPNRNSYSGLIIPTKIMLYTLYGSCSAIQNYSLRKVPPFHEFCRYFFPLVSCRRSFQKLFSQYLYRCFGYFINDGRNGFFWVILKWNSNDLYDSPLAKYLNIKQYISPSLILFHILVSCFCSGGHNMSINIR